MSRQSPEKVKVKQPQAPKRRQYQSASQQPRRALRAPEGYMYIGDASRVLGRNVVTIYRWIHRGWLQAALMGFRCYVKKECVDWWLQPHPYTSRPPVPPWLAESRSPEPTANARQDGHG